MSYQYGHNNASNYGANPGSGSNYNYNPGAGKAPAWLAPGGPRPPPNGFKHLDLAAYPFAELPSGQGKEKVWWKKYSYF